MSPLHPFWAWLLKSSGQAAILVVLVIAIQWILRNKLPPRWRYALWWLVLIRLVLPVAPESVLSVFNLVRWGGIASRPALAANEVPQASKDAKVTPPAVRVIQSIPHWPVNAVPTDVDPQLVSGNRSIQGGSSSGPERIDSAPRRSGFNWRQAAVWLWCIGAAALTMRLGLSVVQLRRKLRDATPVTDPDTLTLLDRCHDQMRTRRRLTLLETSAVNSPALCGLWRPRLLLPPGLFGSFTLQELRFVFLHELAHLKRHDIAMNWLMTLVQVLHWFNPLVWLAFHRMRADRELACDASVLACALPDESHAYGATIIKLLEGFAGRAAMPGLVGILESRNQMKQRIRSIANFKGRSRPSVVGALLMATLAAICLTDARSELQNSEPRSASTPVAPGLPPKTEIGSSVDRRSVRGRIVDDGGQPLAGAFAGFLGGRSVLTDADGRFTLKETPMQATLRFSAFDHYCVQMDLPVSGAELGVVLHRAIRFRGSVRDAETHELIKSFSVVPGVVSDPALAASWNWKESLRATGGSYEFSLPASKFLPFVPVGRLLIESDGYIPQVSKTMTFENDEHVLDVALRRGDPIQGVVLQPDGAPAKWADVNLWMGELNLQNIPFRHYVHTESTGGFSFQPALADAILVQHAQGFAKVTPAELRDSGHIRLQRGGLVMGTVQLGGRLAKDCVVSLRRVHYKYEPRLPDQFAAARTATDAAGRFSVGRVPEGEYWLGIERYRREEFGHGYSMAADFSHGVPVFVRWNATTNMNIGGTGRSVVGLASAPEGLDSIRWLNCSGILNLVLPEVPEFPGVRGYDYPVGVVGGPGEETRRVFWLSPDGHARQRAARTYAAIFNEDGSFVVDDVPSGTYRLHLSIHVPDPRQTGTRSAVATAGQSYSIEKEVIVPSTKTGQNDEPLDLGNLELKATPIPGKE